MSRVRMPADIEREDRILAGLTVRQLLIIGVPGIGVWAGLLALRDVVSLPVLLALAVPLVGVAVAAALVRRDGLSLDQLAWHALRHARAPRRRATPPDAAPAELPSWINAETPSLPPPLDLPVQAIGDDGVIELGEQGRAVLLSCSTVNLSLRTEAEQDALISGFAGFVNSLSGTSGVQMVIRSESVRLDPLITTLQQAAPHLPGPALATAAGEHARFLASLNQTRDLLYRHVLLVVREPGRAGHATAATVRRRAEDAARALAAAGSTATVLDGARIAAVLASAATPSARTPPPQGLAPPEAVITAPPVPEEEDDRVHQAPPRPTP